MWWIVRFKIVLVRKKALEGLTETNEYFGDGWL